MCLISFNWGNHPEYQLILVGNRDEFFQRPTSSLHLWPGGFYGGKDLKGGGTWLGFHPHGRFAALTNYRVARQPKPDPITRGFLVKDFLESKESPETYLHKIQKNMGRYDGFNFLVAEGNKMAYLSNFRGEVEMVSPGIHGISNAFLDTPWPKVEQAKKELQKKIAQDELDEDSLMTLLQSKSYASDELLPQTGVPKEMEKILSAQFIQMGEEYGTVNTTVVLWKHDGEVLIKERRTVPREDTVVKFYTTHTKV